MFRISSRKGRNCVCNLLTKTPWVQFPVQKEKQCHLVKQNEMSVEMRHKPTTKNTRERSLPFKNSTYYSNRNLFSV